IGQVEQDRGRHDRHAVAAYVEADAALAQGSLHARGGVEAEGRTAGKHQRVDRFHGVVRRSEEHTSELQSLMRNSYAVFCLKTKKNANSINTDTHQTVRKN